MMSKLSPASFSRQLLIFSVLAFALLPAHARDSTGGVDVADPYRAEEIPSPLWPTFVETTRNHTADDATHIKKNTRGTLQRCEGDHLIVDFGRHGIARIPVEKTDFYGRVSELMLGEESKQFPNLIFQIGNKLMRFEAGGEPRHITFDEAKIKRHVVLVYLSDYGKTDARDFHEFASAYAELTDEAPSIIACVLPTDRKWYDVAYTIGAEVPFMVTHMRRGYIKSLAHGVEQYPALILADANGKILYRSAEGIRLPDLDDELENAARALGLDWQKPLERMFPKPQRRAAGWKP